MTFKYNNVYLNSTSTVAGPYEMKGPLSKYYDYGLKNFYYKANTWEQSEVNIICKSIDILLNKIKLTKDKIDIHIGGDLLNQIVATNYASSRYNIPLIGIYSACSTSVLSMIIASNMIDSKQINNAIITASSHNNSAEKQYRNPVEYGGPKKNYSTFTTTGCASCFLSNIKSDIKIESSTIGSVIDMGITDVYNMGGVMAVSAAKTIHTHLKETNRTIDYYDLILTGDLGLVGKNILIEYMEKEYKIDLKKYNDSACMIFDYNKQNVYQGGSGISCIGLVAYSYIYKLMKEKKLKKVLLVATGALMNPCMCNQKLSIPSISHAISLEAI